MTPDIDKQIGHMARVSNPRAQPDDPAEKLIAYLINHKHWSPFEMANVCVEIHTTRDISRQILRHRSFHFQEFSQRYATVDETPVFREARTQDVKNRQASHVTDNEGLIKSWDSLQDIVWSTANTMYKNALEMGIAKEVARVLLPEGMTKTRMYMNGTVRDWLHYLAIRTGPETQYEHRVIAQSIHKALANACPVVFEAAQEAGLLVSYSDD